MCVLSDLVKIICPGITLLFHILPDYLGDKTKKLQLPWVYLIPFPAILKPTFPISRSKSGKSCVPKIPAGPHFWALLSQFQNQAIANIHIANYLQTAPIRNY